MATPVSALSTFDTIRRRVQLLTGNRIDPARAGGLINLTLESLWGDHSWSDKKADATLTLVAPKDLGSVTLNTDRRLVDGTDTSFATSDIGGYLRIGSSVSFYQVIGVSGQQLRLETPYTGDAFLEEPYTLFRHIYPLPLDFKTFLNGSYWDQLHQATQQRLDTMDPLRTTMNSTPTAYAMRGRDAQGHPLIEIWPVPRAAQNIRYSYLRTIGPYGRLDGAQIVPLRGDLVAYATACEALMSLAALGTVGLA